MKLSDIVNGPWAITPEMYTEVQGIYARHMRGDKINLQDIEARIGMPLRNERTDVQVTDDGVAVIEMNGVLAKRMNMFMAISGGTSMQIVASQIAAAANDASVKSIVLAIDSPGGTVDGTQTLADTVKAAKQVKPVYAVANGVMASAAYWIGSAATKVYIADNTTAVGSIGVVATHVDESAANEKAGVKVTEIVAGKYKRVTSSNAPLSKEGRADMQGKVDYIYEQFVQTVAENRGVSVDVVLEQMADGRVFLGNQAIEAGLVDGVMALSEVISQAAGDSFASQFVVQSEAGSADADINQEIPLDITIESVKAEHPDVAQALHAEGFAAGQTAELNRLRDVQAQSMPGHEALINELMFDGKTTGADAAKAVLAAERGKRNVALAALQDDAQDVAAPGAEPAVERKASFDPYVVSAKASEYINEQAAKGVTVNPIEAVNHIMQEMAHG